MRRRGRGRGIRRGRDNEDEWISHTDKKWHGQGEEEC